MMTTKARFVDRAPRDETWRGLHRVADAHIADFAVTFQLSVEALRRRISLAQLEKVAESGILTGELADAIDGVEVAKAADPSDLAQPVYAELLHAGATVGAQQLNVALRFDVTSPQVLRAAREMTAGLIRGVSQETKEAVRRVIFEGIRDGVPPRDTAKLLRQTLGLTTRQSLAVLNLRKGLLSGGSDLAFADRQAARFSARLLKDRALNVARTETMRAANRGQDLAWSDMRDAGILPPDVRRRWLTTPDDRLCPRCAPLNGKIVELGQLFRETERGVLPSQRVPVAGVVVERPPLHPKCRCVLTLVDHLT